MKGASHPILLISASMVEEFINRFTLLLTPRVCRGVALAAALLLALRVGHTMVVLNSCFDEPYHLGSTMSLYGNGKQTSGIEQPPMSRLVAGLPLYLRGVRLPEEYRTSTILGDRATNIVGDSTLFHGKLSYWQVLITARLAMLLFPLASLLYLYLLTRWLANEPVAMLAVVFFSTDPTLLGHGMWICSDVAACAGYLAATYYGLRWVAQRRGVDAIAAGVAIGLALSCKFSCLFIIPSLGLLMAIRPLSVFASRAPDKLRIYLRRWPPVGQMAMAAASAFLALWATYLFNVGRLENQNVFAAGNPAWVKIPSGLRQMLLPMPSFLLGMMRLVAHNANGVQSYVNGHFGDKGWWFYFPEAIALKSPVALLLGLALAAVLLVRSRERPWWRLAAITVPPGLLLLAAMRGHVDIGIRHVLPVIPFLYLIVCFLIWRSPAPSKAALLALIAMAFVETGWEHPDYGEFFNFACGGPQSGAHYLIDSNIDWGQDVARLAAWLHSGEAGGRPYSLRLFMYPDQALAAQFGLNPDAIFAADRHGLLAISKNVRYGMVSGPLDMVYMPITDYSFLDRYPIVKRIGYSIDVYDLDHPLGSSRE